MATKKIVLVVTLEEKDAPVVGQYTGSGNLSLEEALDEWSWCVSEYGVDEANKVIPGSVRREEG